MAILRPETSTNFEEETHRPSGIPRTRSFRGVIAVALVSATLGCGSTSTGVSAPDIGVEFPPMSAVLMEELCVRGELVPPASAQGSVNYSDCADEDAGFVFESWRIRVREGGLVQLAMSTDFDSRMYLFRIDDLSDLDSFVLLAADQGSGDNRNLRVQHVLDPSIDYAVFVTGFNAFSVGDYHVGIDAAS